MIRHTVLLMLAVALASCAKREADGGSRTDTTLVFVASPSPAPALRIRITGDAKVYAGDDLVSLAVLDSLLGALKASKGEVWYYREAGDRRRQASRHGDHIVLNAVIRHQLPVRLSSKPDFSDVVDAHGQPSSHRP